jgi:hypothetical protein
VEAGHNALVFNKFTGLKDKIYVPGTHIRIPMIEKVIDYEIRPKPTVISSLTGSKGKILFDPSTRTILFVCKTRSQTSYIYIVIPCFFQMIYIAYKR